MANIAMSAKNFKDLTGQKFNRWIVLYRAEDKIQPCGQYRRMWHCRYDCGNERDVAPENLKSGKSKSCGCLSKKNSSKAILNDLTGQCFGKLIVRKRIEDYIQTSGRKSVQWLCKCDCGTEKILILSV